MFIMLIESLTSTTSSDPQWDYLWAKVRPTGFCWEWTASVENGYGQVWTKGPMRKRWKAHRLVYTLLVGPIPDGLDLDHLCRNHSCVNPDHVVPKTRGDNTLAGFNPAAENARKVVCKRGHELTPANTYRWRNQRRCRRCHAIQERRRRDDHARRLAVVYEIDGPPSVTQNARIVDKKASILSTERA